MSTQELQDFLDARQYATHNLQLFEALYGRGFSSVGGLESAAELAGMLQLKV